MAMTYVEALTVAIDAFDGEVAEKLTALRSQLEKRKGSSGPSKAKMEAREKMEAAIMEVLSPDEGMLATEVMRCLDGEPSIQMVTPRLGALVDAGKVVRDVVKGKAYFRLA